MVNTIQSLHLRRGVWRNHRRHDRSEEEANPGYPAMTFQGATHATPLEPTDHSRCRTIAAPTRERCTGLRGRTLPADPVVVFDKRHVDVTTITARSYRSSRRQRRKDVSGINCTSCGSSNHTDDSLVCARFPEAWQCLRCRLAFDRELGAQPQSTIPWGLDPHGGPESTPRHQDTR